MTSRFRCLPFLLAASAVAACNLSAQAPSPTRHALLVGVTEYPELEKFCKEIGEPDRYRSRIQLRGPAHDVRRMADTLTGVLEIPPADIRQLVGWPDRAADRPTRANIESELRRLTAAVRPGDLVVVYLAGHGARVPDLDKDERDGLDEVFLPADTRRWDRENGVVGAILDDEIGVWVAGLRKAGARVVFLVDACFSGTMLRGEGEERVRSLDGDILGCPEPTVSVQEAADGDGEDALLRDLGDGVAAMFAVDSRQQAVECRMPRRGGEWHGLFTWHLTQQLARSGPGVSLSELQRQVATALAADQRGHLVPTMMGDVDRAILDGAPAGLRLQVGHEDGRWFVTGGSLCGLRRGDVLEVFERGRRDERAAVLARVVVDVVRPTSSVVIPEPGAKLPAAKDPTSGELLPATLTRTSLDLRRLRLFARGGVPEPVREQLAADEEFTRRAEWIEDAMAADAVVTFGEGGSGALAAEQAGSEIRLAFPAGGLTETVFRLYRARSLLGLTQDMTLTTLPRGLALRMELLDEAGKVQRELQPGETVLPGQRVQIAVENRSQRDWDVYVFAIDAELQVGKLLPQDGGSPTVLSTDRGRLERRLVFNDSTQGAEQILFLVVPAGSPSLLPLADSFARSQEQTRGVGAAALVTDLVGGQGAQPTRGITDGEDREVAAVRMVPYVVGWGRALAPAPAGVKATLGDARQLGAWWMRSEPVRAAPAADAARARDIGDVYGRCAESVVVLRNRLGYGTGFLIDGGRIVTNHHVVAEGVRYSDRGRWIVQVLIGKLDAEGMMKVSRDDILAEVVHADARRDLALLEVLGPRDWLADRKPLQVALEEEHLPRPSVECVIMGHPSSGMLWSFRPGRVSATGSFPHDQIEQVLAVSELSGEARESAKARLGAEPRMKIVISTCGANRGDSGGPLVDGEGRVLGVTFAVPRDTGDKEFTYHVHPRELKAFLDAAPAAGAQLDPQVPTAWRLGAEAIWQPQGPLAVPLLLTGTPDVFRAVMIDLDRDSTLPGGADGEAIVDVFDKEGKDGSIDAELALQFTAGEKIAFYDRDADGAFDLVLVEDDGDAMADVVFELSDGRWSCSHRQQAWLQLAYLGGAYRDPNSVAYRHAARVLSELLR